MNNLPNKFTHIKLSNNIIITVLVVSIIYLVLMWLLIGLKAEHWFLILLFLTCFFMGDKTRRFILAFSIFIIYGILYDVMKAFPNYLLNHVDIEPIYRFEKYIFGITINHMQLTINEFWGLYHNTFLDITAGIFYISWIPVPLAFALYLYIKNKKQFLHFSLTFFLANIIGFCIYYIHPAAPPWYVSEYGFKFYAHVPSNTAGLVRFDQLIHFQIFSTIYSRNSNIFAAIPSLHCAYPVVVFYYALKNKLGKTNWLFGLFMAGIWFAAVYSGHHYVTDVILGIICAIIAIIIFQYLLLKTKIINRFLTKYECSI
jgi:inositol phosphorylceramide synthase catalytic subunit